MRMKGNSEVVDGMLCCCCPDETKGGKNVMHDEFNL
jgi:hypothetical protein